MLDTLVRHLDMVRLSIAGVAILTLIGCSGLIDNGPETALTPEQKAARDKWFSEALPVFKSSCVSCHTGSDPTVAFLAGSSDLAMHDTLMAFDPQVVNLDAPESSRVLTKGAHSGPALMPDQAVAIQDWIVAEKTAAAVTETPGPTLETARFVALQCTGGTAGDVAGCSTGDPTHCCPINTVTLDNLGLVNARISFVAQPLGGDIYISDLYVDAAADGVYIEHPLFVSWPATGPDTDGNGLPDPKPDTLDRFFAVKLNLMPTATPGMCPPIGASCNSIGGGAAVFTGFAPSDPLTIHFKVLDIYHPDTTQPPPITGCRVLDSFKTNVVPIMGSTLSGEANNCANCHMGQNSNATSALNLAGIKSTDDTMIKAACDQVRTRVNFQSPAMSGVILAPQPGQDAAHPFKFATQFTSYSNAMNAWISAEATAM